MALDAGGLRSRLLGADRATRERMATALESRLDDTEAVAYRLTSTGGLRHEADGGETHRKGGGDGGTLLAVTDRKLVFVVDTGAGLETADVPYTDLKGMTADSGLLSTTLSARVWGRGTYSIEPNGGDGAERVAAFATAGSRAWQRVVAALQDARQHISTLESYATDGDMPAARDARASARSTLETAQTRIAEAQGEFHDPLERRGARVEAELSRTWAHARSEHATAVLDDATDRTDAYGEAALALGQARAHLERALALAAENEFAFASEVDSTLAAVRDRLDTLRSRPLTLADRSRARAQTVDTPELAVVAWEEALGHYRDALEAAWGLGVGFDGDTDALRYQIEWVVATLVSERSRLAVTLESTGDDHDAAGNSDLARDHYRAASEHLARAHRLARQYRAGDADALAARLARLRPKVGA